MRTRVSWSGAIAFAAVVSCLAAGSARAQAVARPAGVRVTQKDWAFVPVVVQDVGTLDVPGVLALRDKSQTVGDNLVAVWYENPGVPGAAWAAKSWESQDQWEAIKWAKEQYGIGDEYDSFWPTTDPPSEGYSTEAPQNYFKGLMTDDPFSELTQAPNAEEIMSMLTEMGYKSASINIDQDGACDTTTILSALADTTAYAILAQPPIEQVEARFAALVPATCAQVVPAPPPPPVIPGTTRPQPGTPLNPGAPWQTDQRPSWFNPTCTTVTTCCYSQYIIWLYTTTNWLGLTVIDYCESQISWSCPNPSGGACPPTQTCTAPPGPLFPPSPPGPVLCGYSYY